MAEVVEDCGLSNGSCGNLEVADFRLECLPGLGVDVSVSGWLGTSFPLFHQTEVIPRK